MATIITPFYYQFTRVNYCYMVYKKYLEKEKKTASAKNHNTYISLISCIPFWTRIDFTLSYIIGFVNFQISRKKKNPQRIMMHQIYQKVFI